MKVVFVSDIFGLTPHLVTWAAQLQSIGAQCDIVTPYRTAPPQFLNDQHAYEYFLSQGGHAHYLQLLQQQAHQLHHAHYIIAFSAGASAVWALSSQHATHVQPHVMLFYPSQIRNQTSLQPHWPTEVIFAHHETHFDVVRVMALLKAQQNPMVRVSRSQYLHGFLNPQSDNFNQASCDRYQRLVRDALIGTA